MSARQAIDIAQASGIRITVDGGDLVLQADGYIPDVIVADFKQHKAEILGLLRPAPPLGAPSWWPKPHPAIRREPPFGSDDVPECFQTAWQALLARCPPGVTPFVWEVAIYDAALLFGDFGSLLDNYRWLPGDLFDLPGGFIWFIKGSPVVAIGPAIAQCQDGRIWKRLR